MIGDLNDEFRNYKSVQDQYRYNPIEMGSSINPSGLLGAGEDGGSMMNRDFDSGMVGGRSFKSEGGGLLGRGGNNSAASISLSGKAKSTRYDSDQRHINESMNNVTRHEGQERYSPSKVFENNDQQMDSSASQEGLLDKLKVEENPFNIL